MSESSAMDGPTVGDRARKAFCDYLLIARRGNDDAARRLLDEQAADVRQELDRMLADFRTFERMAADVREGVERRPSVGGYRLRAELGRGATGAVFEAERAADGARVALKVLHPHLGLSSRALARFEREAFAASRIAHPGIVEVFEVGSDDEVRFIAQERIPGGRSLADRIQELRRRPRLDDAYFREMAELFRRIAIALQAAHDIGIIHRDVKPENVLLTADGDPKVADFGLAQLPDELGLSRTGELLGTPAYMSPEQASGSRIPIDAQTDVFSLGASLYEALTLRRPFDGTSTSEMVEKILLEDPPDPRSVVPTVPAGLVAICMKALEKQRKRRYANGGEMAAELESFLCGGSIVARPHGRLRRAWRWCRRHPTASTAVGVASVAFVAITWLLVIVNGQRLLADELYRYGRRLAELGSQGPFVADESIRETITDGHALARRLDSGRGIELLIDLSTVLLQLGKLGDAEDILSRTVEDSVGQLGENDRRTLEARWLLGRTHAERGDFARARFEFDRARARSAKHLGDGDALTRSLLVDAFLLAVRLESGAWIDELCDDHGAIDDLIQSRADELGPRPDVEPRGCPTLPGRGPRSGNPDRSSRPPSVRTTHRGPGVFRHRRTGAAPGATGPEPAALDGPGA